MHTESIEQLTCVVFTYICLLLVTNCNGVQSAALSQTDDLDRTIKEVSSTIVNTNYVAMGCD